MPKVWVLGAGQLGAMLRQAGMPLGIDVRPVDADYNVSLLSELDDKDKVTPEIESWPSSQATNTLAAHPHFINRDVFPVIADRFSQKQALDKIGVATAPWLSVTKEITEQEIYAKLGETVLLKRRRGGYDGRGQYWLKTSEAAIPNDFRDESIAEKAIAFTDEISIIGVRAHSGETRFYPLSQNHHVNGILKATIGNGKKFAHLQLQAEKMLTKVLEHFNYVGVMAMECFVVNDNNQQHLLVNELAPRVHKSGHWTQAGCSISQFESHVRAITDLPLGQPSYHGITVMLNLVGTQYDKHWLEVEGVRLHWYQKEVRPGRKLGHINILNPSKTNLTKLAQILPEEAEVFDWLNAQLSKTIL